MKFRLNLIQEIALEKKHTQFRYFVALNLFDISGQGWVSKEDFIPFVTEKFHVTPKTVNNNLQKLHTLRWVNNIPDRVYYRSQEFVLSTMHPHQLSKKAVYMTFDDLEGDIVDFRAFIHECTIAGMMKNDHVTIARDTIHDQLNGHTKRTQRKYEKRRGVKPIHNFARLEGEDELELTYKVNQPVFPVLPDDLKEDLFYVRQLPNTYKSKIKIGMRKRKRKHDIIEIQTSNASLKLYFHDGDKVKNVQRVGYIETKETVDIIMSGRLWDECYIE